MSSLFSLSSIHLHPPTPTPTHTPTPTRPSLLSLRKPSTSTSTSNAVVRNKYKGTVMREEKLTEMIKKKVAEAMDACEGEEGKGSDGCKVAWDEVEEVSQAKADLRRRLAEGDVDPLESFCRDNPETDECRVYED